MSRPRRGGHRVAVDDRRDWQAPVDPTKWVFPGGCDGADAMSPDATVPQTRNKRLALDSRSRSQGPGRARLPGSQRAAILNRSVAGTRHRREPCE